MRKRTAVMVAACFSLVGCMEYGLRQEPGDDGGDEAIGYALSLESEDEQEDEHADEGAGAGGDSGSVDSEPSGEEGSGSASPDGDEDADDPDPEPGATSDNPRDPDAGEMVISEIMIDPDATTDRLGEWVELENGSSDWINLAGHRLADEGVDDHEILATGPGSLVVGPGDFIVICVSDDRWDNGGVDCQGTVPYEPWGGGFALANGGDEVALLSPGGVTLDRFAYGAGFAHVGASMGVDPDYATVHGNDAVGAWCDQWSFLPGGDSGNPGEPNDWCW
ncbi:MAG: lamin tail domain-containing protein [Myxococcota bacterium]|nr:lamin tail domain-containing protein [Myxococcota bacterium]